MPREKSVGKVRKMDVGTVGIYSEGEGRGLEVGAGEQRKEKERWVEATKFKEIFPWRELVQYKTWYYIDEEGEWYVQPGLSESCPGGICPRLH